MHERAISRDVELWRAVILQAIADATSRNQRISHDRDEARAWLLSGSGDFLEVCRLAGLDANQIRIGAEALKRRGWPFLPCNEKTRRCRAIAAASELYQPF